MMHYIEDNNKKAKAYIDSEDGKLFVSVYDKETDKQYDFGIDEKELQLIAYMIEQGKEVEKMKYTEEFIRSLGAFGYDTDALMREWKETGHIECLERGKEVKNG